MSTRVNKTEYQCYYEVINDSKGRIKHIVHASDIHIRNDLHTRQELKREQEYINVFKNFRNELISQQDITYDNTLIVITGDIMHEKILSATSIRLMVKLLRSLSKVAPVLFMSGNHDCNMHNSNDVDIFLNLIPLVCNIEGVHYLAKTGVYRYRNIFFGVTHARDPVPFDAANITKKMYANIGFDKDHIFKVGLFHGALNKAVTHEGYVIGNDEPDNEYVKVDNFDGYDAVMLGDIHKFQYMDNEKSIVYAGSLLQQNHAEHLTNHGFVKWTMKKNAPQTEFVRVSNNSGFHTINMNKVKLKDIKSLPLSKSSRVRLLRDDTDDSVFNAYCVELEKRGDVIEITHQPYIPKHVTADVTVSTDEILRENISTKAGQIAYMREYLKAQGHKKEQIKQMVTIHQNMLNQINEAVGDEESAALAGGHPWQLVRLEFDNMFCYGENNVFDFEKNNQSKIIGIIAPNHSGKSSILDIILFTLFERCSRGKTGGDVMNTNKNKFVTSLTFRMCDKLYMIERIGTRKDITFSVPVNFYEHNPKTQKWNNINGKDKKETNLKIISFVGQYNDFLTTSMCLQNQDHRSNQNIINLSVCEKTKFFTQMLRLGVFGECHKMTLDKIKDLNAGIDKFKAIIETSSGKSSANDMKNEIDSLRDQRNTLQREVTKLERKKIDLPNLIIDKRIVSYNLSNSDSIANAIRRLEKKVSMGQSDDPSDIRNKIDECRRKIEKLDYDNSVDTQRKKWSKYNKELLRLQGICNFKLPRKVPKNKLKELKFKHAEVNQEIENVRGELEQIYDPDFDADNVIDTVNGDIIRLQCKIVDLKKQSNNDLLEERDSLEKILQESMDSAPLDNFERDVVLLELEIKDAISSDFEIEINTLMKVNNDYEEPDIRITKLINKKKKWIALYQKDKKKHQKALSVNQDDFAEREQAAIRFAEIDDEIKKNNLNNDEYEKNKKRVALLKTLKTNLSSLRHLQKLILELTKLAVDIEDAKKFNDEVRENCVILQQIDTYNSKCTRATNIIDVCEAKLSRYNKDIEDYESQIFDVKSLMRDLDLIRAHKIAYDDLEISRKLFNEQQIRLRECIALISSIDTKLDIFAEKFDVVVQSQKKLDELLIERQQYSDYKCIVRPDCLPHSMLKKYLPIIINNANAFLSSFSDFLLDFSFYKNKQTRTSKNDGPVNNTIALNIVRMQNVGKNRTVKSVTDIDKGSGYERFIANLALRFAFRNVSGSSRPNFYIIDEGWSCFDKKKQSTIKAILECIQKQYRHVVIISHLDYLKDSVEYPVFIKKDPSGFSRIDNTKGLK